MNTPVADFIARYAASNPVRLHMPGHKGVPFLGCEGWDITEIQGADVLRSAEGILLESQQNAASLFGSRRTLYATGGSSQCVKAMLGLAMACRQEHQLPLILAARNVHQSFLHGCGLLDIQPKWVYPRAGRKGLCDCLISAADLEEALSALPAPPAAVYVTSPDYLGNIQPIKELAEVAHRHGTVLLVDNAHGAYLKFIGQHPMDLGADVCCDSAHKTLPVLTGGAYLHIGKSAPAGFAQRADEMLALFGSTSPSYLIMASLDLCNQYLSEGYRERLKDCIVRLDELKERLIARGWVVLPGDPLRLTVHCSRNGISGEALAEKLRQSGIECEFADRDYLVLMLTPENTQEELARVEAALDTAPKEIFPGETLPQAENETAVTIRQALFAEHEKIPVKEALGRICADMVLSCPPAIPIAVAGERIGETAMVWLRYYKTETVTVVK